jgi:single-strand DNA-binding protein
MNLNRTCLAGNLTRDPALRYTPGGTAVAQFGLAVNRKWKTKEGEQREEVLFVDIETWGRQAESTTEYLRKGSGALIEGRLKLDQWESKDTGEKRSKIRVVAERVHFMGRRNGDGNGSTQQGAQTAPAGGGNPPPNSDIPF